MSSQPVTTTVASIATVKSAGRIHFDCVAAVITLMILFFIFITLPFFVVVENNAMAWKRSCSEPSKNDCDFIHIFCRIEGLCSHLFCFPR